MFIPTALFPDIFYFSIIQIFRYRFKRYTARILLEDFISYRRFTLIGNKFTV